MMRATSLERDMSDQVLLLIPSDPTYRPAVDDANRACDLLQSFLPKADEVTVAFKDGVEFFDPGENWSGVACAACGADAEAWWFDAMDAASQAQFNDLMVTAPCCGARISLNDLRYAWPAAFGCFVLEAVNPSENELTAEQMCELQKVIGHCLRAVWTRV